MDSAQLERTSQAIKRQVQEAYQDDLDRCEQCLEIFSEVNYKEGVTYILDIKNSIIKQIEEEAMLSFIDLREALERFGCINENV